MWRGAWWRGGGSPSLFVVVLEFTLSEAKRQMSPRIAPAPMAAVRDLRIEGVPVSRAADSAIGSASVGHTIDVVVADGRVVTVPRRFV